LLESGDLSAAWECYQRAIRIQPSHAEAHYNMGNVCLEQRRTDEAIAYYDRAIQLKPDYAEPYWNKAFAKLPTGDYDEGWRFYEWRWKGPQQHLLRVFPQPLWLGDRPIAGNTIFIHSEQG